MNTNWDVTAFDRFAPLYDVFMPSADHEALRKGLACADRDVERIVEVGGGTGRVAREVDAVVVDPARGMLERARKKELDAVQATATELPHPDGSIDAVVFADALHHFPEQSVCLREAARVLASGGVLIVREFDRSTRLGHLLAAGERLVGFDSNFYTADELIDAVATAGLEARPVEYGFNTTVVGVKP